MSKSNITSNTGNASVTQQGHTTDGAFGSDPMTKKRYGGSVRDLKRS